MRLILSSCWTSICNELIVKYVHVSRLVSFTTLSLIFYELWNSWVVPNLWPLHRKCKRLLGRLSISYSVLIFPLMLLCLNVSLNLSQLQIIVCVNGLIFLMVPSLSAKKFRIPSFVFLVTTRVGILTTLEPAVHSFVLKKIPSMAVLEKITNE